MKAVVCAKYGPPEVLLLRDVGKPAPGDHDVLIKIHATAVTSSDCYVRGMNLSFIYRFAARIALGFGRPRQPVLGMVFAGVIESVGKHVSFYKPGDRVFGMDRIAFGAYAEYKTMPETGVIAVSPHNLTHEEAAALPYGGILALAFLRGKVHSGQRIMVYGASGAVGTAAVQLAKHFGAQVTGVCGSSNLELVKALGADQVMDYMKDNPAAGGCLYDLIFDAVGKRRSSGFQYRGMLAPEGSFISVDSGTPKMRAADLSLIRELAENGKFMPVIDRRYMLEQMEQAHRYVDIGHKKGNVVITVPDGKTK